ncbi:uncharacterized protein TNIN_457461 [Trichonephila inaurata madagascariensis]|uniref:Uncharacterized protein n=1 Tax=Trichonephila inaurata madagascariensis TaxID=2747483 RepID=A0A8X7CH47_9ARAC|nr:uncharacterized protein TNIN_457461 [Trichonephila inaurata madagascariensis]
MIYCRTAQEMIFPSVVAVLYCSNCYFLLSNLRFIKGKLEQQPDLYSEIVRKIIKNYFIVLKGVEKFEDLFSAPIFVVVVGNFCIVPIIIMDMMYIEDWISSLMLESVAYLAFIFATLGVLSVCAANIPLEISRIKSVLLDKLSCMSNQTNLFRVNKQVSIVLKRDSCILTGCNVFQFDRGFLLRALVTVISQAVLIFELGKSIRYSEKSLNNISKSNVSQLVII